MQIDALVLAAGDSSRLGRPKQLLEWGGKTLLEHVVAKVRTWPVDSIWVVLGSDIDAILESTDLGDAGIVENPEWAEGIASSLRSGLDAIARRGDTDAVVIVLGDQPEIDASVVEELVERYRATGGPAVVPKYRYQRGNPVLIDRSLWPRLMSLEGDHGAGSLLQAHPEWVEEVWVASTAPRDVDTPEDVEDLHPHGR